MRAMLNPEEAWRKRGELQIVTLRFNQKSTEGFLGLLGIRPEGQIAFSRRFLNVAFVVLNTDKIPEHLHKFIEIHERVELESNWAGIEGEEAEEYAVRAEYFQAKEAGLLEELHLFAIESLQEIMTHSIPGTPLQGSIGNLRRMEIRERIFAELDEGNTKTDLV